MVGVESMKKPTAPLGALYVALFTDESLAPSESAASADGYARGPVTFPAGKWGDFTVHHRRGRTLTSWKGGKA